MGKLWLRLMAWLFGPRPVEYRHTFSASVTGPVYLGGSVRADLLRHMEVQRLALEFDRLINSGAPVPASDPADTAGPGGSDAPFSPAEGQWLHAAEYPLHRGTTVDDLMNVGRGE